MKEREKLGSRLGFIMLSAGCAIGCGNVWKFPWSCGQNGGGSFMLVYFLCLILLGLPAMTMEFAIGRAAQTSPLNMYGKLAQKAPGKWGLLGYICLIGNCLLMTFYTVVAGWMLYYFYRFITGRHMDLGFGPMISNPMINVGFLFIVVAVAFLVLSFGIQKGLEKVTKIMMMGLLLLILVLVFRSFMLPGAGEGLRFYLIPDFSKLDGSVVVAAMNQAFFTLSIGMGSMAIFGSYIDKERSLLGETANIIALDTFVAVAAGLIIFPACFTYQLEVGAGPSLLFDTMAQVFVNMQGGRWWGSLFFLFMVFAAMSTVLAVCENILAMFCDLTHLSRGMGCIICGIVIFLLGLTTALGFSVLEFHPFGPESVFLDFWDFIVSNNILPLGSLALSLFCCYSIGWGWEGFMEEANTGRGLKVRPWMKPLFKFLVPAVIVFIYIYGIV